MTEAEEGNEHVCRATQGPEGDSTQGEAVDRQVEHSSVALSTADHKTPPRAPCSMTDCHKRKSPSLTCIIKQTYRAIVKIKVLQSS